jgi:hypothetical protein
MIAPFKRTYCNHSPNFVYMIGTIRIHHYLFLFIPLIIVLSSCEKFDGDQTIPAYLKVDAVDFNTDYSTQGTEKQKITDVWIYVNDQVIGGFEMPTQFPVLNEGPCKIEIRPGIILNGISSTRADYPYFQPIIFEDFNLVPDSVISLENLETVYRNNTVFVWKEDFEDAALAIKPSAGSDTGIFRTEPADNPVAFLDENSSFSGMITLDASRPYMMLESDSGEEGGFDLREGNFIFLEIHVKSDVDVTFGMLINQQNQFIEKRPYIGVRASEEWNKIYVNYTPIVLESTGAVYFIIYLEAFWDGTSEESKIYLDNIKLLSRQNL